MENERIKLTKNQKNNKKLALRRKKRNLSILERFKLKKQLKKDSILEETLQGQIIKDFSVEINKEKVIDELKWRIIYDKMKKEQTIRELKWSISVDKINKDKVIEELKLIISYDKISTDDVDNLSNKSCTIC